MHFTKFERSSKEGGNLIIIIASATGVSRGFYSLYAEYLVAQPSVKAVYTFDYQGIGNNVSVSELKTMKSVSIKKHWVQDTEKMFDQALLEYPQNDYTYIYIGHSVGGHLLGFLDGKYQKLISRGFFVGVNIPYWKYLGEFGGRFWIYHSCIASSLYGYYPSSHLGLGLNLPKGVGAQWGYWSRFENYMSHNPKTRAKFYECKVPIEAIGFSDDTIAKEIALKQCTKVLYPQSYRRFIFMDKDDLGLSGKEIGHFKFFKIQSLWEKFNDWVLRGKRTNLPGRCYTYEPTTYKGISKL